MNILIVSKVYNSKKGARAVQMSRVVQALIEYGGHKITLVTEGSPDLNKKSENIETINIATPSSKLSVFGRVFDRWVCSPVCFHKDKFLKEGVLIAEKLIAEKGFELVLTVSFPVDSHIIGLTIKRRYPRLKWIVFFSDMWPLNLLPKPYKRKKLLSKLEKSLVQNVIGHCDGFLTPCEYTIDILEQNFKTTAKLSSIPHCLDESIHKSVNQLPGYIVHSGFLHKERIKESFVEAISELATENKEFKGLIHIGPYHPKLLKSLKKYQCNNIFSLGIIPEELAVQIQSLFETGIIIESPMEVDDPFIPSKITDSVQLNRKLVVITPKKSFLTEFAANHDGINSCIYDKESIKHCILKTLNSTDEISPDAISYFHPTNVARRYTHFFDSVVSQSMYQE